jgi:hypothetical protein
MEVGNPYETPRRDRQRKGETGKRSSGGKLKALIVRDG